MGAPAHRVRTRAERASDHDGELGHRGAGDGVDHLGAVLGDPARLVLAADHETGDVLEEQERDAALGRKLDEVCALERRLGEQHPVVGEDPDALPVDAGEAGDERVRRESRLELGEATAVGEAPDDLVRVVGDGELHPDDIGELEGGRSGATTGCRSSGSGASAGASTTTMSRTICRACSSFSCEMVGDAGDPGVHDAAAQVLGHDLAGGGLHERRGHRGRSSLVADDHRLVAHRGHVGAAGGGRAEDGGDLRGCRRAPTCGLVVAEVVPVGEDLVLHGQEGAAGSTR